MELRWTQAQMASDGRAFQHWPWPWADLDGEQQWCIEIGVAGHCTKTALRQDGSAGLHSDPVVVLDFASLYPSCFIAPNMVGLRAMVRDRIGGDAQIQRESPPQ